MSFYATNQSTQLKKFNKRQFKKIAIHRIVKRMFTVWMLKFRGRVGYMIFFYFKNIDDPTIRMSRLLSNYHYAKKQNFSTSIGIIL